MVNGCVDAFECMEKPWSENPGELQQEIPAKSKGCENWNPREQQWKTWQHCCDEHNDESCLSFNPTTDFRRPLLVLGDVRESNL